MKLTVEYDVLPSDWCNLFSTFIDGGLGREWWRSVQVQHFQRSKKITGHGRWMKAYYGEPATYADDKTWRIVLHTHHKTCGDRCFDGTKWGWAGVGDMVRSCYDLTPELILRAAVLDPALFIEWIGSGERNLDMRFDAGAAETIMQLAAFGTLVYA